MSNFLVFVASGMISATPVQTNQVHFAVVESNTTAEQVAQENCDDYQIIEKSTIMNDTKTVRFICKSEQE